MRRFAAEMIAISRYELRSRAVSQKGGGVRMGGVGLVTYRALGGDRYWWRAMQMLADFAQYSGAGVRRPPAWARCGGSPDYRRGCIRIMRTGSLI